MTVNLIRTKLYTPLPRTKIVQRSRLFSLLNSGLDRVLILVSAPAGFGKSTLLSSWLSSRKWPAAWVSLDGDDNELNRFLFYVVAALRQIEPSAFGKLWGLLQSSSIPPRDVLLQYFINEVMSIEQDCILVLDDYHKIDDDEIHETLAYILANAPRLLHLVISSRKDPPFSIANLRAQNELIEIHEKELRFDASEALSFFQETMGISLELEQASILAERTEGWIVGLQFAALSIQDQDNALAVLQSFSGDNRYVEDYLIDEVLSHQPQDVQDFLLQTSILGHFCDSLCNWLTGRNDSQTLLEGLENAHLFIIPLDEHREWYRYHHLFSELLIHRLKHKQPDSLPRLYNRASVWYEERAAYREAVNYALAAEDYQRAANLIENNGFSILWHGGWHVLSHWLEVLPVDYIQSKPGLWYLYLWTLINLGRLDSVNKVINWLKLDPEEPKSTFPAVSDEVRANLSVIRGVYAMHCEADAHRAWHLVKEGLRLIPESSLEYHQIASINYGYASLLVGKIPQARQALQRTAHFGMVMNNPMAVLYANINLAELVAIEGHLQTSASLFQDAFHYAYKNALEESLIFSKANTGLGKIFYEWNDLEIATQYLKEGLKLAERSRYLDFVVPAYTYMARLYCAKHQLDRAHEMVELAEVFARKNGQVPFAAKRVAALRARLALKDERTSAALRYLMEAGISEQQHCYFEEYELITLAKVWAASGKLIQAIGLLRSLLDLAFQEGRMRSVIAIQFLLAKTHFLNGSLEHAYQALQEALLLAEPEGYLRIILDEGEALIALLIKFAHTISLSAEVQDVPQDYLTQIISVSKTETGHPSISTPSFNTIALADLTDRELEILDLVAAGLSNQEIAEELVVAVNTVKWHLKNVYSKLDVNRRTQAVKIARRFELIS
jgi:LuxR family maltose regulon positive regulatory protein